VKFAIEIRSELPNGAGKWVDATICGFSEMARARKLDAARCWLAADTASHAEADFAAIEAVSRSNAGTANGLLGNWTEAERCLADAERAWRRVIDQIASLEVPLTGASSSFHFRLAAKSPEALADARRHRYRQLSEAALAITRFNRLFAGPKNLAGELVRGRARELIPVLAGILGSSSPEARLLAASAERAEAASVYASYADKLAEVSVRGDTFTAAPPDKCAQLESAVALTAMLAVPMFIASAGPNENAMDVADWPRQQPETE
jgi:hypothetical protein